MGGLVRVVGRCVYKVLDGGGVWQVSPTFCIYIIFVNDLIALVKNGCVMDWFVLWLHMMVDSVVLSTTRQGMEHKLNSLH